MGRALAAASVAALCYYGCGCFVGGSSNGAHKSLRGQDVQYAQFEEQLPSNNLEGMQTQAAKVWASALASIVACGLVAGVMTPAARAMPAAQQNAVKIVEVSDSSVAVALKQYVNPSDEREEDEVEFEDWTAEHPVQFILTCLIPVFIYLTFYILGSLEII